jgi:integrase
MRHCKSALSGNFKEARRIGVLDTPNPLRDVRIHRTREVEDTHAYSVAEINAQVARLSEPAKTIVLCAAFSGLRKSELRGLTCDSFDAKTKELNVKRSVRNSSVSEPKTPASKRPVPVVAQLSNALAAHLRRMGKLAQPGLPLFQAGNGKPLNLDNLARRQVKVRIERCTRCGKPEADHETDGHPFELDPSCAWHGWHAYRRGLATNLHALGVDDKTIQAILRHSNIRTTQSIYIKSLDESRVNAMDVLSAKILTCNENATTANSLVN